MSLLSVKNLIKGYAGKTILHNLSISIEKGKVYGLLGPNGAGKTSLIRIITGIIDKGEGELLWNGSPLDRAHLNHIGYLPEERGVYTKMRVAEYLLYLGNLRGIEPSAIKARISDWLERLNLTDRSKDEIGDLSKGNQQKVQFIAAVLHEPELLILDEPLSGFDPANEQIIIEELLKLKATGCTILLSTHRMDSVEDLCEEIIFLNQGKIVYKGTSAQLRSQYQTANYRVEYSDAQKATITGAELKKIDLDRVQSLERERKSFKEIFIDLTDA